MFADRRWGVDPLRSTISKHATQIPFLIVSVTLFFTTLNGLNLLLHPQADTLSIPTNAAEFRDSWHVWALASIIDLALIGALTNFRRYGSLGSLTALLLFVFISGGISTAYWFKFLRGVAKTNETTEVQVQAFAVPLIALRDRLKAAATTTEELATYSARKADAETSNGGTCDVPGNTAGPRADFRRDDANFFRRVADGIKDLPNQIEGELTALSRIPQGGGEARRSALAALNHASAVGRSVLSNPVLTESVAALKSRAADDAKLRTGKGLVRLRSGKSAYTDIQFTCRDSGTVTSINAVVAQLQELPKLPTDVAVDDFTTAAGVLKIPFLLVSGSKDLNFSDLGAVVIAVVIECALLLFSGSIERRPRRKRRIREVLGDGDNDSDDWLGILRGLFSPVDGRVLRLEELIDRYTFRYGWFDYIVVALNSPNSDAREVCSIMRDLEAAGLAWRSNPMLTFKAWFVVAAHFTRRELRERDRLVLYRLDANVAESIRRADFGRRTLAEFGVASPSMVSPSATFRDAA